MQVCTVCVCMDGLALFRRTLVAVLSQAYLGREKERKWTMDESVLSRKGNRPEQPDVNELVGREKERKEKSRLTDWNGKKSNAPVVASRRESK